MVCDQGDQRLPQRGGVAAHVCGPTRGWGELRLGRATALWARPWPPARTHSHPGGPSPLSGTCVPRGRGCWAQAGRWAGQTGSGQRSAPLSSPAGSGLGERGRRSACPAGARDSQRWPRSHMGCSPLGHGAVSWEAQEGTAGNLPPPPHLLPTPAPSLPSLPSGLPQACLAPAPSIQPRSEPHRGRGHWG